MSLTGSLLDVPGRYRGLVEEAFWKTRMSVGHLYTRSSTDAKTMVLHHVYPHREGLRPSRDNKNPARGNLAESGIDCSGMLSRPAPSSALPIQSYRAQIHSRENL